jgi:hypothetical protein
MVSLAKGTPSRSQESASQATAKNATVMLVSVQKLVESNESFVIQGKAAMIRGAADVDAGKSQTLRPQLFTLSKRRDR